MVENIDNRDLIAEMDDILRTPCDNGGVCPGAGCNEYAHCVCEGRAKCELPTIFTPELLAELASYKPVTNDNIICDRASIDYPTGEITLHYDYCHSVHTKLIESIRTDKICCLLSVYAGEKRRFLMHVDESVYWAFLSEARRRLKVQTDLTELQNKTLD